MVHLGMTVVADDISRVLVLIGVAFVAWLVLLVTFRRVWPSGAGLLAALLSWALASLSVAWIVDALQQHHAWPLV